jgi:hypothetical protein
MKKIPQGSGAPAISSRKDEKHPCQREKCKNNFCNDVFHSFRVLKEAMVGIILSGSMFFILSELGKEMTAHGKMFFIFPCAVFS